MSESELLRIVTKMARSLNLRVYHTINSKKNVTSNGFPDLVLVGDGGVMFVELKTEKGIVSDAQYEWGEALGRAGARFDVWRPRDVDSGKIAAALVTLR